MINTARQSPKFLRFVRQIRPLVGEGAVDAETIAVGLLERIWHATATGAIRGDIGRFDDDLIAEMAGWRRSAEELIEALVHCGWLDRDETHRLVVHDWHEHAPKHVKGNVARIGGFVTAANSSESDPLRTGLRGPSPKEPPLRIGPPNLTKEEEKESEILSFAKSREEGSKRRPKKSREPDPVFDAIAEITASDPQVSGSHIGKIAAALKKADPPYSPDEIRKFGREYARLCPWAKVNIPTLGEVEKYIGRVRNAAIQPINPNNSNPTHEVIDTIRQVAFLTSEELNHE